MELKDYVKEVISQIADAIGEINRTSENKEVILSSPIVNPTFTDMSEYKGYLMCVLERSSHNVGTFSPSKSIKITEVDFDVTLYAASKSDKGGKVDLRVLGGGASKGDEASATNRVKFTLPVLFPSVKQPHK